jgi:multicomponent K+:H+ antiporter subunit A
MLYIPLLFLFLASLLMALGSIPAIHQRVPISRLATGRWSLILAAAPFTAFLWLLWQVPNLDAGDTFTWQVAWLPSLELNLGLYLDSLGALFALLITFIGTLIVIYAGQYFKGKEGVWRFQAYILLFMTAMLGVVLADDVISLFIFWEGTSIVSFLLVAYQYKDKAARKSAFKALFITGGGGIALLAGLLFMANIAGSTQIRAILAHGETLRTNPHYLLILALIAFGAFTKSAQFPAHIWLPGAMHAPTPASAYLHSATMVKAGIYLLARLNPALGFTEEWFWLLTVVGIVTMLVGAYLGLKQNDLKAVLAYSTISQLGILVMLLGQDDKYAYKAMVIGVLAHALYKSALFMAAGIVDHEAGTRDLRHLGGLRRVMPITFGVTLLAALSMAGLPPLFGFLAKETLLASSLHPSLPPLISEIFTAGSVIAGALMLAMAGMLVWDIFFGKPRDPAVKAHEAPALMWLMPAIPAVLSLVLAQLPGAKEEATFLASAATAAFGSPVQVSLKLWTGLNVPFVLSVVAISLGFVIFLLREQIRGLQNQILPALDTNRVYDWVLETIDKGGQSATRLQTGSLRFYLSIIGGGAITLAVLYTGRLLFVEIPILTDMTFDLSNALELLRIFSIFVMVGAAAATVFLRRDFSAVLALGALGLGATVLFILEPSPDVALVQVVVDILSVVILVLALTRLPREQREEANQLRDQESGILRSGVARNVLVSAALGTLVAMLTLVALVSRPRESVVTRYYAENAKKLTGALDIVGAIVTDFRAEDTLIEITVFSMAGLGIYTLLRYAAQRGKPARTRNRRSKSDDGQPSTMGIGGSRTSAFIRIPTLVILPLSMVLATVHMMYGHEQPGDGFTAGVIVSLAVGLWYIVFGYRTTLERLPWLRPFALINAGILFAVITGIVAAFFTGHFLGNVDFGELVHLPLPYGFHISTSFFFEVAICLSVLGAASFMIDALGRPEDEDAENREALDEIEEECGQEPGASLEEIEWKS